MFCTNCGKQNADGKKFCQYCGAPLDYGVPGQSAGSRGGAGKRPVQRKASFRMRPVYWVLIAEAALAVAGIILGWMLCRDRFSAERTALEYAQAFEDKNWGGAYDCLLMEGETGLSREDYIAAMEVLPDTEIDQVTVEELASGYSAYQEQNDLGFSGNGDYVNLEIRGRVDGDMQSAVVTAVRTGKKWFFFDEWKIIPYNMYGENVEIRVPQNAVLTINGKELGADGFGTLEYADEDAFYDTYLLPHVFYGGYQIRIEKEGMEPWTKTVEYSGSSDAFDFSDVYLYPDGETVDELLKLYGEAGQEYFSAALSGEDFSALQTYFTGEALEEGGVEDEFEDIQEAAYDAEDGYGILSVEISGLQAESVSAGEYYDARPGDVVLELSATVALTRGTGGGAPREAGGEREWPRPVCFRMEEGVWKIHNPEFQSLVS